ncbi:hypothetical protein [Variovorax sp. HJSM1_2]|uniref:hypothetical protein n=1 Tax=Variovorax sp. HJSM1_2 TaxID=3366263 RepID=UPI003BE731E9
MERNILSVMKPSPRKVVWNDWPALAASIAIPIVWLIHFGFPYLHRGAAPLPIWFAGIASVVFTALLLWRYRRIAWLFAHGQSAWGQVTGLRMVKDRGRLEFEFMHQDALVASWMPVHKTKDVLLLSRGDRVEVLFDLHMPTRAIVRRLYSI